MKKFAARDFEDVLQVSKLCFPYMKLLLVTELVVFYTCFFRTAPGTPQYSSATLVICPFPLARFS